MAEHSVHFVVPDVIKILVAQIIIQTIAQKVINVVVTFRTESRGIFSYNYCVFYLLCPSVHCTTVNIKKCQTQWD